VYFKHIIFNCHIGIVHIYGYSVTFKCMCWLYDDVSEYHVCPVCHLRHVASPGPVFFLIRGNQYSEFSFQVSCFFYSLAPYAFNLQTVVYFP
jgi:hypothetical protein